MFNTLRNKLIVVFIFFCLFATSIYLFSSWSGSKQQELENIKESINEVHLLLLKDSRVVSNFFTYEISKEEFLETEISQCLERHYKLSNQIKNKINQISGMQGIERFEVMNTLDSIHNEMYFFDINFNQIITHVAKRGNNCHGLIGELDDISNELFSLGIQSDQLLLLRLYENEYLLNPESHYIDSIKVCNRKMSIENEGGENKTQILSVLKQYENRLNEIYMIDVEVGLSSNSGLKEKLENSLVKIEDIIEHTILIAESKKEHLTNQFDDYIIYYLFFVVVVMLGIGFVLASAISSDVSELSAHLSALVKSDFMMKEKLVIKEKRGEIGMLVHNVELLQAKVHADIDELERKVSTRTVEVERQKEEIENQKEELLVQHESVVLQNKFIQKRNKIFTDSLNYAKNIQDGTLPSEKRVKRLFPDSFILFKAKDKVSGDFYWMKEHTCCGKRYKFFVVADCTGHGVPGAFMSLLGISFLNDILTNLDYPDPSKILNQLRYKVIKTFQDGVTEKLSDGMDVTLGIIDVDNNLLHFSGANHNMHVVRNNQLEVIKGDRMPVGEYPSKEKSFTTHVLQLFSGDVLYAFSDGYPDQFSGVSGRKYYLKRFKQRLLEISQKSMGEQKMLLDTDFNHWKAGGDQTDDVLVMGLKIE